MITINREPIDFKNVFAISSDNDRIRLFNDNGTINDIKWNNIDKQVDELDAIFETMAQSNAVTLSGTTFKSDRIIAAGSKIDDVTETLQIYVRGVPNPINYVYLHFKVENQKLIQPPLDIAI